MRVNKYNQTSFKQQLEVSEVWSGKNRILAINCKKTTQKQTFYHSLNRSGLFFPRAPLCVTVSSVPLSGPRRCLARGRAVGGLSGLSAPPQTIPLWRVDALPRSHRPGQKPWRHRWTHTHTQTFYCCRVNSDCGRPSLDNMIALWLSFICWCFFFFFSPVFCVFGHG